MQWKWNVYSTCDDDGEPEVNVDHPEDYLYADTIQFEDTQVDMEVRLEQKQTLIPILIQNIEMQPALLCCELKDRFKIAHPKCCCWGAYELETILSTFYLYFWSPHHPIFPQDIDKLIILTIRLPVQPVIVFEPSARVAEVII